MGKLSSSSLRSLPTGSHSDGDGLILRVFDSGKRSWALQYSVGKQRKKVTLGHYPALSLSEARGKALQTRAKIKEGLDPNAERMRAGSVQDAINQYLRHSKFTSLKATTRSQYELYLNKEIAPRFGRMNLTDLKREHVAKLISEIEESGRQATAAAVYRVLRRFLNWSVRTAALVDDNPCLKLDTPKGVPDRDRVLSDNEIRAILSEVTGKDDPYSVLIQLLFWTACRLREIAKLRWEDINAIDGTIVLKDTKNGRQHIVPLCSEAASLFQGMPRAGSYVISGSLGAKPFSGFSKAKARLDNASGVHDWRVHDIRRTVATKISECGFSREVVRSVLNHTDGSVTAIYDRNQFIAEKREALQTVAEQLNGLLLDAA